MVRVYRKLIRRTIGKNAGRYLSLIGIVGLGIGVLLGLFATTPQMELNSDRYFDQINAYDTILTSPTGFTNEAEHLISLEEGVDYIEGYKSIDVMSDINGTGMAVRVSEMPEKINQLILQEGRMVENEEECVVDISTSTSDVEIGDRLVVDDDNLGKTSYLIVGVVDSPLLISKKKEYTTIGDGTIGFNVYVEEKAFTLPVDTKVALIFNGTQELNSYEDDYTTKVSKQIEELKQNLDATYSYNTRADNIGMEGYQADVTKVAAVGQVFPIFFFGVTALVVLTSITRLIEEERSQLGLLKALSYTKVQIAWNYLWFSLSSGLIGVVVGVLWGNLLLVRIIANIYGVVYDFNSFTPAIDLKSAILVSIGMIIVVSGTTAIVLQRELRHNAAILLTPKAPKAGKRILLERIHFIWNHLKFSSKVTFRNLFRYKARFWMTVIGIAGCYALLVTGFGIRDSLTPLGAVEYEQVLKYNVVAQLKEGYNTEQLDQELEGEDYTDYYYVTSQKVRVKANGQGVDTNMVLCDEGINDYVSFNQGEDEFADVTISRLVARNLDVKVGDTISIEGQNIEVGLIYDNYIDDQIYISKDLMPTVEANELLIKSEHPEKLTTQLLTNESLEYAINNETIQTAYTQSMDGLNAVVWVLIIIAGVLAMIVLYNLININICERKKELATIEVLGFYDSEIYHYIFSEIRWLCSFGILLGIVLGKAVHYYVMLQIEADNMTSLRQINWSSYLYSALITYGFMILVNLLMRKHIKKINMAEALKENE